MTTQEPAGYADLRRLAEQATQDPHGPNWGQKWTDFHAAANPQAILALLDERDHDRALIGTLAEDQALAERRVAALEEGLRNLTVAAVTGLIEPKDIAAARALLAEGPAALPAEPGRTWISGRWERGKRDE